uniref:Uncharacterized protein n=1 Tax=Euplotes harpa TaxID=151035 RepID=A0A7S3JEP2_9SPIT|mmetsp:Transcript_35654/g.41289  ORF Transcript_35654/g.41289 Transcript_35654/m.41289 type:complete len:160 (+) Transcript_35654:231-710(+)
MNRGDLDTHIEEERGTFSDLVEAVAKNKMSDVETMYEHGNDIFAVDTVDLSNNTLLHIAVSNASKEAAEFLVTHGIDVNVTNANNETALHHAIAIKDKSKAVEVIQMMLLRGADPHLKDKLGDTPIEKAKRLGKSDILFLFVERDESRVSTPSSLSFRM